MLALRLPADLEKRLEELARKTGRSKSYYARLAIAPSRSSYKIRKTISSQ
jgi:predicted DNA-binding protein